MIPNFSPTSPPPSLPRLRSNKAHIRELQEDNTRLTRELNELRSDLVAANSQLRAAQEQLARLRAAERGVCRGGGLSRRR